MRGKIIHYNKSLGYGFIKIIGEQNNVFFHKADVIINKKNIEIGRTVDFELIKTENGYKAVNVKIASFITVPFYFFSLFGLIFLIVIVIIISRYFTVNNFYLYLISVNILQFLLYGYDKMISGTQRTRIPEKLLHLISALGGTVGALLGMTVFKHKRLKIDFKLVLLVIFFLQLLIVMIAFNYYLR
jgi:uncharacterized membrane protein YsdA (DUF1294 family)/cold shock CspA family protein